MAVPIPEVINYETLADWVDSVTRSADGLGLSTTHRSALAKAFLELARDRVREAVVRTHGKWVANIAPGVWQPMFFPLLREVSTKVFGEEAPRA